MVCFTLNAIKETTKIQQSNLRKLPKKDVRLNTFYDSDGEPGPFCDMKYLEDTQYFDEYALPDIFP